MAMSADDDDEPVEPDELDRLAEEAGVSRSEMLRRSNRKAIDHDLNARRRRGNGHLGSDPE